MARLVNSSDYDRALIGGFVTADNVRRRQEQNLTDFRETVVRSRGSEYLERFTDRTRALDIDTLLERSVAINRHSRSAFRDEMIMDLDDIGDIQHASTLTQRYLLSDRQINYKARNQRIEAWGTQASEYAYSSDDDRHFDPYYRSMNNGMMQVSDNGKDMFVENYLRHSDDDTVVRLSYTEQRSLYRSRDIMLSILSEDGEDPSSKFNNLL